MARKEIARIKLDQFPGDIQTQISEDGKYVIVSSETKELKSVPIDVTQFCHVELRRASHSGGCYVRLVYSQANRETLVAVLGTQGIEVQDAERFNVVRAPAAVKSFQVLKMR